MPLVKLDLMFLNYRGFFENLVKENVLSRDVYVCVYWDWQIRKIKRGSSCLLANREKKIKDFYLNLRVYDVANGNIFIF